MLNKNPVNMLVDPAHDQQLLKEGYIVFPFLDKAEIIAFRELYKKWHPEHPKEFFKSYFDSRMDYKAEIEEKVLALFEKKMNNFFENYNAFGGMFVVKPATKEGHIPPHQDWSFVNEKKDWSINMWCALEDVDHRNGSIRVLRGSHQFYETIRGINTPDVYREHWELIEKNMESISMKAGEAIFFFHGLLHGSDPNTNQEPRLSLGLTLTPKNKNLSLHILNKETKQLKSYSTTPKFYIDYASKRGAEPEIPATPVSFDFSPIPENKLIEKIKAVRGVDLFLNEKKVSEDLTEKENWMKRLKGFFRNRK